MSYSPPTPATQRTPPSVDEWGAQRSPAWSLQSTIPSPRQWAYQSPFQSQEDLPSPVQHISVSPDGTPPQVGFEIVYHNPAEIEQHRQIQQELQAQQYGMAWHVHNVFENIQDNYEEIMEVLGGRIHLNILQMIGPGELMTALDLFFASAIARKYGTPFQQGDEYDKVSQVLNRLFMARREYLGVNERNEIFTWLQFVMRQPDSFQFEYIDLFINDTFFAYDGEGDDKLSCVKGISERLLLSIADACILYCIQYKKKNKKKNETNREKQNEKEDHSGTKCENREKHGCGSTTCPAGNTRNKRRKICVCQMR